MTASTDGALRAKQYQLARRLLPAIVLAAFAIRMVVVFFTYRDLPDANKFYEQFGWEMGWIARALASGHGYSSPYFPWSGPTALQPPLYPTLLSLIFRVFGIYSLTSGFIILSLNSLFSALTCIPVYFSAQYSLGSRGAKIAAWVWAFYPFAIYFSAGRVWEYSLTCLLFTICFCIAQRIHLTAQPLAWLGWGALFGLTALSNPAVLSTLPFLFLLALWRARRQGLRTLLNGALTFFAVLAFLVPWTVRNYRAMGILCPVRDNFWLEIYTDNFGDAYLDRSSPPSADNRPYPASSAAEMKKFLSMGEPDWLRQKHALAVSDFHNHPRYSFLVTKTLRRMVYYWTGFWSLSAEELRSQPTWPANMFYVTCMTLLMLRGICRFWHFNRSALLPYLILIGFFPVTYYITHPLMDYRQPIEPVVVVLAVAGAFPWRRMKPNIEPTQPDTGFSQWIGAERALQPLRN